MEFLYSLTSSRFVDQLRDIRRPCFSRYVASGSCRGFCQTPASVPWQPPDEQPIPPRKESIVVIGAFVPAPLKQNDRSVESFRMRKTPLLFNSVIDYLQFDPSIDLQQRAANGVQADLTILGSTFAETLVLLDGLRINDAQTAHHDMDIPIRLEAISRIEVLHGAGSTFYGSDTMGGRGQLRHVASPRHRASPTRWRGQSGIQSGGTSSHRFCFTSGPKQSQQTAISPQVSYQTVTIAAAPPLPRRDSILLADTQIPLDCVRLLPPQFLGYQIKWTYPDGSSPKDSNHSH